MGDRVALHVETFGSGPPAIFVHGTFGWGLDTFPDQRELSDGFRVFLADRVGYGATPGAGTIGWHLDAPALAELMEVTGPAHLVGHSYGGVVALLAAGSRPDLVRSLTVIEPPLLDLAADRPNACVLAAALRSVYDRGPTMTAIEFRTAWSRAMGGSPDRVAAILATYTDADWRAVEAARRERWPGDAPVDFGALRAAAWPRLVVVGTAPAPAPSMEGARAAFRETSETLAERIGARILAFEGSAHNPQLDEASRFNATLRTLWASGDRVT